MSLNDPQWGKRGRGGPPDLDEIWRNVNRRVNELFGRREAEEGSGKPQRPRFPLGGVGLLLAVVAVIWLASGFYIVDEGRRGVVTLFGRYTETTLPGPRWHLPYPIEAVEVVDFSKIKTVEIHGTTPASRSARGLLLLTDDENITDALFAVQYRLKDAKDYVFNAKNPDDVLVQVATTAISEVVGRSQMDFVLYEGRGEVARKTEALMQEMLDRYGTGIQIQSVSLQDSQPPEQVRPAFDDAVKAGQDLERQKNEGQAYANDIVPRARGLASRLLQEADGYSARVTQEAEGNASRFKQILVEYDKAPAVTRERLYLDMMQSVLGSTSKVLVDQKGTNSLLYLPLDQLLKQAQPGAPTNAVPEATRPTPPPDASLSLDGGRPRELPRSRGDGR
ncbi:MAG TPA: FtsH protease activity modulator HflK [Casimicrobiaceae bacterium]|jgi:membrane protease subunit HflK|nr:FtsH protease activity modulator HflK [Casimicrobiaceae bacterium]